MESYPNIPIYWANASLYETSPDFSVKGSHETYPSEK